MITTEKIKYEVPEGYRLEIYDQEALEPNKQDSAWYTVYPDGSAYAVMRIFKVNNESVFATVNCVGEMRIQYGDRTIRYQEDIRELINDDTELEQLQESGKLEFHNNSWFEVWTNDADEYTEPCHSVQECFDYAIEILKEQEVNA